MEGGWGDHVLFGMGGAEGGGEERREEGGGRRCRAHRERRATTSRREISMSLRGARGRGAAASRRLDGAPGLACGGAPNLAPSSCHADPSHFPNRLPGRALRPLGERGAGARQGSGLAA